MHSENNGLKNKSKIIQKNFAFLDKAEIQLKKDQLVKYQSLEHLNVKKPSPFKTKITGILKFNLTNVNNDSKLDSSEFMENRNTNHFGIRITNDLVKKLLKTVHSIENAKILTFFSENSNIIKNNVNYSNSVQIVSEANNNFQQSRRENQQKGTSGNIGATTYIAASAAKN